MHAITPDIEMTLFQSWTWIGFIHGLDWVGLDWVRSFVRFIVFPKTETPSSCVFFR